MMATQEVNSTGGAHTPDEEDTFERDLKEMLKDGPTLSDLSPPVLQSDAGTGGAPHTGNSGTGNIYAKIPPQSLPGDNKPNNLPPSSNPPSTHPSAQGDYPATTSIPLSSPDKNGHSVVQAPPHNGAGSRPRSFPGSSGASSSPASAAVSNKLDIFKSWSINTYKCTRQMIVEKLGKGSRTVDLELESQIERLRDTQRKYANILRLSRALTNHFYHVVQTQRALGEAFSDMSQKSPELQEEFSYNAETQKAVCKNGETLLGALNFFTSSVNTLCNKTMEDTIQTIKLYEQARIEYDAYRADLESLNLAPREQATGSRITDAQQKYAQHKEKFDRLRADVAIKLKFLEENKVKVMHKQLLLLHNAVSAYFSGNQNALEATLKQFNIKLKPPNTEKPSWIEQ